MNCTESCIPIILSSFFDTNETKICKKFHTHFCAIKATNLYIQKQLETCIKPPIEKYFKGFTIFRRGIYNYRPEIIDKEREGRTLINLYWKYKSNVTTIIEEKLVYDSMVSQDNYSIYN